MVEDSLDPIQLLLNTVVESALWLISAFFIVLAMIFLFADAYMDETLSRRFRKPFAKTVAPQVAYKRAFLLSQSTYSRPNYFKGVTGTQYGPDEDAENGHGFHAYDSFEKARNHPQRGNVLLEVLLSGGITQYSLGAVAEHQRVLQIIVERCSVCDRQATHFIHKSGEELLFMCPLHTGISRGQIGFMKIFDKMTMRPPIGIEARPIAQLGDELEWVKANNIVVSQAEGARKFIPTQI